MYLYCVCEYEYALNLLESPFKGEDPSDTFNNIKKYGGLVVKEIGSKKKQKKEDFTLKLVFPDKPPISKKARALIKKLLNKKTNKRLLSPSAIRADPWFRGMLSYHSNCNCQGGSWTPRVGLVVLTLSCLIH